MAETGTWRNTGYNLTSNNNTDSLMESLKQHGLIIEKSGQEHIVYNLEGNQSNFFLESDYMITKNHFSQIIKKLSEKHYETDSITIFNELSDQNVKKISVKKESKIYSETINENNITGLSNKDLNISINMLSNLKADVKVSFIQDIYILFFLANRSYYHGDNTFTFVFESDDKINKSTQNINFEHAEHLSLARLYNWIVNESNYPKAYKVKLKVIREIILNNAGSSNENHSGGRNIFASLNVDEIIQQAKSAFNRIIAHETEKYFEQMNRLKDDFFSISESVSKSYRSLQTQLMAWLSSIAIFIYNQIISRAEHGNWRRLFFSNSERVQIVLVMLFVSLLVITIMFLINFGKNKEQYRELEKFYTRSLHFNVENFKNHLKEPKIERKYITMLAVSYLFLIIRFIFPLVIKLGTELLK